MIKVSIHQENTEILNVYQTQSPKHIKQKIDKITRRNKKIHSHGERFLIFPSVIDQKITKNIENLNSINKKVPMILYRMLYPTTEGCAFISKHS